MPDEIQSWTTAGTLPQPTSGTSGSTILRKVGFEDQWQSGWQSITSTTVPSFAVPSSVTTTGSRTDQGASSLHIKRAKRDIRWYKVGEVTADVSKR